MKVAGPGMTFSARGAPGAPEQDFYVVSVAQRNWSRVGLALTSDGQQHFLKQFIGRNGELDYRQFEQEIASYETAAGHLVGLRVTPPAFTSVEDGLLIYPWQELRPLHEIDDAEWSAFLETISEAILALRLIDSDDKPPPVLRRKSRPYPSSRDAVVFKGLEVRNLALRSTGTGPGEFAFFDPGPVHRGPLEEVVARLVVSAWLLDWRRSEPQGFVRPAESLRAQSLYDRLSDQTHEAALEHELKAVRRTLTTDPQARSRLGRRVKGLASGVAFSVYSFTHEVPWKL